MPGKADRAGLSRRRLLAVAAGVLCGLLACELGLRAASAVRRFAHRVGPLPPALASSRCLVYTLGESTTADTRSWGRSADLSWPARLAERLRQDGSRAAVVNLAVSGSNSSDQLERLRQALRFGRPALVVAMLGVNDVGVIRALQTPTLMLSRAWLWLRLAWKGRPRYSEYAEMTEPSAEKAALLRRLEAAPYGRLPELLGSVPAAWRSDPKFRLLALTALSYRSRGVCALVAQTEDCRRAGRAMWSLARRSLDDGDSSPRLFQFLLRGGLLCGQTPELRRLVEARLEREEPMSVHSADLLEALCAREPSLRSKVALLGLDGRYAATRAAFRAIIDLSRESGFKLVFMQYPAVPPASLERLLSDAPAPRFASYPDSFDLDEFSSAVPPPAPIVSNLFVADLARERGYDRLFTDRFAFAVGARFGHMTPRGNRLLAENLFQFIKRRGLLPADACR